MKKSFFKKNERPDFYSLLEQHSSLVLSGISSLKKFMESVEGNDADDIDRLEHEADEVRKELVDYVETSFITPVDRHDLFASSRRLDDIIDKVKDIKDFMVYFELIPLKENIQMVELILKTQNGICDALGSWSSGDDKGFWRHITEAKNSGKKVKQLYWDSLKVLESENFSGGTFLVMKEFSDELSILAYKTKKAIDRISDTKIKEIG